MSITFSFCCLWRNWGLYSISMPPCLRKLTDTCQKCVLPKLCPQDIFCCLYFFLRRRRPSRNRSNLWACLRVSLPCVTTPIPSGKFIFRSVTIMAGSKVLTTTRLAFFNSHVWISKPYYLYLGAFFCKNCGLFVFARCSFWLVVPRKSFTSVL